MDVVDPDQIESIIVTWIIFPQPELDFLRCGLHSLGNLMF